MLRNRLFWLIPLAAVVLFMVIYFIYAGSNKPAPKPLKNQGQSQYTAKWYIQFSVKKQKATAYTEAASAPVSSSGKKYFVGSGAVHPRYPLNSGGHARNPIIPFGTTIYLSEPIEVLGEKRDTLVVNDTGDVYYGLWPAHPYWVDVYFGQTNNYNAKSASQAGVKLIDYTWYEPWPAK